MTTIPPQEINNVDPCDPILFTMPHTNPDQVQNDDFATDKPVDTTECSWWNSASQTYTSEGCIVSQITNSSTICACTHLTVFQIKVSSFVPKVEMIDGRHTDSLTWENIKDHPTVFIVLGCMTFITLTFLICGPDVEENRPILAQDRIFLQRFVSNAK